MTASNMPEAIRVSLTQTDMLPIHPATVFAALVPACMIMFMIAALAGLANFSNNPRRNRVIGLAIKTFALTMIPVMAITAVGITGYNADRTHRMLTAIEDGSATDEQRRRALDRAKQNLSESLATAPGIDHVIDADFDHLTLSTESGNASCAYEIHVEYPWAGDPGSVGQITLGPIDDQCAEVFPVPDFEGRLG